MGGVQALRDELRDARPLPLPHRAEGPSSCSRPRVVVRKRPLFELERERDFDVLSCEGSTDVWGDGDPAAMWITRAMLCADHKTMYCENHCFYADAVFDESASTAEVYASTVRPLVDGAFGPSRTSATVLCFGQTGSGKTYTLGGIIEALREDMPSSTAGWRVSALEIAGAVVTDLLHDSATCMLRDDAEGNTHVVPVALREQRPTSEASDAPLSVSVVVTTASEAIDLIVGASHRRSTHATGVHDASSRTHAVYKLEPLLTLEGDVSESASCGYLSLVDLAGSEWSRDQASHAKDRRKEAQEVNTSLSVLKACLAAREAVGTRTQRMPARDTALTRVLRGALEGDGRMALIATVSPASADAEHAIDTLYHVGLRVAPDAASDARQRVKGESSGRVVFGAAAADGSVCGAHVLTRRLVGKASLTRGQGASCEDEQRPLPSDPRQWTSAEVVRWWLDTSSEAVETINLEIDESATLPNDDTGENAGSLASGHDATGADQRVLVVLNGADWPPRTKMGLSFQPQADEADAYAPPVLSKVSPGTPVAKASPLIRPGARLLNCEVSLTDGLSIPPGNIHGEDTHKESIHPRALPKALKRSREELLAELRRGAQALIHVADALDSAKTEATRAHEEVPRKLDDDAALLRAWVMGGDAAREEERRRIANRTPEDLQAEEAKRVVAVAAAQVRLDEAKMALEAAAEKALRVEVILTFEPPPLGRAQVPRVPRHFSGASRLGQGDGKAFVNAYGDPDRGLRLLIGACEGDTRVAGAMHSALSSLLQGRDESD